MGGEVYITGLCTTVIAKRTAVVCALVVDYFDHVTPFYHSSIVCPFVILSVGCLFFFIFTLALIQPNIHINVNFSFRCSPPFLICYTFQISTVFPSVCILFLCIERLLLLSYIHFLIVKNQHIKNPILCCDAYKKLGERIRKTVDGLAMSC